MLSTVDEMHLFYRALFESDKLLKPDTRKLRFNVDEPMGSGGMDGATYFVYERDPRIATVILIASTSATAPALRRELEKLLGLTDTGGLGFKN